VFVPVCIQFNWVVWGNFVECFQQVKQSECCHIAAAVLLLLLLLLLLPALGHAVDRGGRGGRQ
jgi:hypothetical protein